MQDPKPKLKPDVLYVGDNGRLFCGKLSCAGMSSHFTGRDISGQKVVKCTKEDAADWHQAQLGIPECEGCGMQFKA